MSALDLSLVTRGSEFELKYQFAPDAKWETVGRHLRAQTAVVGIWDDPSWLWLKRYISDARWIAKEWWSLGTIRVVRRYTDDVLWDSIVGMHDFEGLKEWNEKQKEQI